MLRLEEVERRLGQVSQGNTLPGPTALAETAQPTTWPIGTQLPAFRLPDVSGRLVALEDFRGRHVLLVHWSPHCGYCVQIAPDLARLDPDLSKRDVQLVLVSRDEAEANRSLAAEHDLACPILLQDGNQNLEVFHDQGTPVAYLLDELGLVARPLAVGTDHVMNVAREAAGVRRPHKRLPGERPLAESRIERTGLKAGTLAPTFRLPDIYGHPVALEEYRGRPVLLVFTDPDCGPCEQLAPHLVRLHQEHRDQGLAVVMVGRGDAAANRRKAEEYGFDFPVVLQQKWELSRQYGIFATPVAFLLDEKGVIMHNVAHGVDEILALASQGRALRTTGQEESDEIERAEHTHGVR